MRALWAVVVLVACGGDEGSGPADAASPSFSLEASGASVALGTRGQLEVRVLGHGGFDGEVEVSLRELPEGVTASPARLRAGETGRIEIQVVSTAENGERRVVLHGEAGQLVAELEVELILPGHPGDLDHSFSADGLSGLASGHVAALAVDAEGRTVIGVQDGDSFRLRRLRRDGSDDPGFAYARAGDSCFDLVAWPDGEVVVLFRDVRPRLLRVDALGQAATPVPLPEGADALGLAVSDDALLVAGTWQGQPGVWKLDRELQPVDFGVDGFAGTDTPFVDARGVSVIERADGVVVLAFHSQVAQAYSLLALTPAGELLPDFELPTFAVDAIGRPELHALADGRLWMTDGASAGFQVFFADRAMTELHAQVGLPSPVDQPALAVALAGHPGGGAVVVGGAAGDLVWTRFDDAEQRVDSFRHRQPMGAEAAARAIVALPDGRLVVAGDVGAQHVVLRLWP